MFQKRGGVGMESSDVHSLLKRFSFFLCALPLVIASSASAQGFFSGPDPNWREGEHVLPPPPSESALRQFFVSAASPNRFFLDESSLVVGEDRVVRYVLVIRTAGGAQNVSFEGIRCESGERRIYALGRADGEWVPARRSEWERISTDQFNRPRAALAFDYFCDGPMAPRSRDEALRRLREGGRRLRP